jgi:hypothetical protein
VADLELDLGEAEVGETHRAEWKTASYQQAVFPDQAERFPHNRIQ